MSLENSLQVLKQFIDLGIRKGLLENLEDTKLIGAAFEVIANEINQKNGIVRDLNSNN